MKLNLVGSAAVNQPARSAVQRGYVAALWLRLGGRVEGTRRALEIGCGRGAGLGIIVERFGVRHLEGIDLDPTMIERAARRAARLGSAAAVAVGDAARIDAPDQSFDAVFDFGAIHLMTDWRAALREVRRVLKPGGSFYFEEIAGGSRSILPVLTDRSAEATATGFDEPSFLRELDANDISVRRRYRRARALAYTGLVGDLIGVGMTPAPR
jgi:ubiquinone/menaquinone biosynthesis C-methylase UbiE